MTEISPFGIRRAAFIRATPDRIWKEFTSFERMRAWYGTGHTLTEYQPKVGAVVETAVTIDGVEHRFRGEVVVCTPGRELTFEQHWIDSEWQAPSKVTILLTPAAGGTLVELFHHGYELLGGDLADLISGFEDGWDTHHLDALRGVVES